MSSWIVSKQHIDFLVSAARQLEVCFRDDNGKPVEATDEPDIVGQILWDENFRSVNFRYDEDSKPEEYHYDKSFDDIIVFDTPIGIGFLCKALDCYEYQSCENNDFRTTMAFSIVAILYDRIASMLLRRVPNARDAREAFPWGFEDRSQIDEAMQKMADGKDCFGFPVRK